MASSPTDEFRWKQARENLLSDAGIRMFQLAYNHRGEEYELARKAIDAEYTKLSPRLAARGGQNKRHGGSLINSIGLLEELGLMYRETKGGLTVLESTPRATKSRSCFKRVSNFLKVIPYFLLDVLSRYRLNNPQNKMQKDARMRGQVRDSDVFPYWTIYKIMRVLGHITKEELRRFVFKIKRMDEIEFVCGQIRQFRADKKRLSPSELDAKYGQSIEGAAGQSKYIMGRAGYQTGVIELQGDTFTLNKAYLPFIDDLLSTPPSFDEVDEESWIASYGRPVDTDAEYLPPVGEETAEEPYQPLIETPELAEGDEKLAQVRALFADGYGGVIITGAPGTGKTWYARQIALHLTGGDAGRIREIQFHPSYQYEDFVEGYVPAGPGDFEPKDKHLIEMCKLAERLQEPVVLVIDEFSRSDPVRVMGEALTYMASSQRGKKFHLASGRPFSIPPNLHFLATMNPEDRSVDEMDAAMERRWGRVGLVPDTGMVNRFLGDNGMAAAMRGPIVQFFQGLQEQTAIGHAYFRRVRDRASLRRLWDAQLLHLLRKQHRYSPEIVERATRDFEALMAALEGAPSP